MAAGTAVLVLKIVSDVTGAQAGLAETSTGVGKVQAGLGRLTGPALLALGGITALGAGAASAASDVEQSMGAVETVFKDNADTVKAWSRSSSKDVGLAQSDYAQMAAVVGSQLKGMGVPLDDVAGQTNDLIKLSADLAATYGGDTAQAVEAVSSLLRGERDPIERYGVALKQVDVDAQLAALGSGTSTAAAAKNANAVATLTLLTAQTADAQGAFARESDTAAHAQQVAGAAATDMAAALGVALLPVVVLVSDAITGLSGFITDNKEITLAIIAVVAAFAAE